MRVIILIKRELKSLFCRPLTLAFISALSIIPVVVLATFLAINQAGKAYAGFESVISFMVLIFALAIPVTSIISTRRKRGGETEDFLLSMPISRADIMLSRLFSQIIYFALPTALIAIFPLIFKSLGEINLLHAYLALLMLAAFEIFIIALCVMIASLARKTWLAFVISYSVITVSFVLGVLSSLVRFLPLGTGFDKIFGGLLFELSIFKKVDTAVYELFDWTALLFFACGALVFALISIVRVKRRAIVVAVSAALVACIGAVPLLLPYSVRQIDVSENKLYSADSATGDYLSSIDEKINVYLIDPYAGDQEFYDCVVRMIEPHDNINLKIINSLEDQEFLKKYDLDGVDQSLLAYAMVIESAERSVTLGQGDCVVYYNSNMGYLTLEEWQERAEAYANVLNQYGSYYDQMDESMQENMQKIAALLESLQYETVPCWNIENVFVEAVSYVLADIPREYLLSGHGEEVNAGNIYDLKKNGSIPDDAELIVINSPSEDYSASEIDTIIDYVDNGGKLYVLADVDNYAMPNLMRLLSHYGLSVGGSPITVEEKTILPIAVNKSHEAFAGMTASEVTMKGVSKITVSEESKYSYSTMLSYKHTEGEGDDAKTTEYPVAVSVSEGKEKRITLFTGATTFNSNDNGIGEEELERVSPCVSYTMSWMFDGVDLQKSNVVPKAYQRLPYSVPDGRTLKITLAFAFAVLVMTTSIVVYIASRGLRSKRVIKNEE